MRGLLQTRVAMLAGTILVWLSAAGAQAATVTVTIDNFTFAPATVTVHPGDTVTWTNQDDIPHVVAEKDGKFRSSALDTGDSYSQTFSAAGKVDYYCAIHPHMTGTIVVAP